MKKFSKWISSHSLQVVLISIILLIPTIFGYINTRINYDILVYLPETVDTIKGEKILTEDFGLGAYAFIMIENQSHYEMLELEEELKKIENVNQVFSIADLLDTTIPVEMLPDEIQEKVYKENETIIMVTFKGSASEDTTIKAVRQVRETVKDVSRVSSMTAMVIDTMDLSSKELVTYVIIAVLLCLIVLTIATDSYIVPILLLANIGIAIIYNMGTNIFLGEISYITKAITAILQLGVTTDFSIFLYHKYEQAKQQNKKHSKQEAMATAITETFKSVLGSSLTTFAGFLALCTMDLTLGTDIGIVMAKGVVCGLICVLTLFPALLLVCDKIIDKTKHKSFLSKFENLQKLAIKYHIAIMIIFVLLFIPAYIGNKNYQVYYKLDESLPNDLGFQLSNSRLKEKFHIVSPEIILLDKNIKNNDVERLIEELKKLEGIDLVLAPSTLINNDLADLLPETLNTILNHNQYQLIIINSTYEVASNELNEQINNIEKMIKKYDKNGMIAGEGALMKDLVTIADHDFKMVNYTSLLVIFIIMIVVLKSISLPIVLIIAIEFAIFLNMAFAYYTSTALPFIASIIVGTIQLGATIDYAILMSTRYLEERQKEPDKRKAMKTTLSLTVSSIITSALCFFGATIGVALYTKIDMIGSICQLLARGSIISMVVVIIILPSLLMLFDKFISKNSNIRKKEKSVKKFSKPIISTILITSILIQPFSVFALNKEETIYTTLDWDGTVYKSIVNNHLYINETTEIEDDTELTNLLNLNGKETFLQENGIIKWNALGRDIFYRGTIKKEHPITVQAKYYLNNEEKSVKELIGKEGNIKIEFTFKNNCYHEDKKLYTPFVVTVGTTLNSKDNQNINIINGKVINTGSRNILVGISSPGLYESLQLEEVKNFNQITITFDTKKFALNDIYMIATPKLLEETDLSIFDKMNTLNDSMTTLQTSVNQIENGAKQLEEGSKNLVQGTTTITNNIQVALTAIQQLSAGSITLNQGLKQAVISLEQAINIFHNKDISGSINNLEALKQQNENAINLLEQTNKQLESTYKNYALDTFKTEAELIAYLTTQHLDQATITNVVTCKKTYESNKNLITLLEGNNIAHTITMESLKELSNQINTLLTQLYTALSQLEAGSNTLNTGLQELQNGIQKLYDGTIELNTGNQTLTDGITTLTIGIRDFNQQGIHKLSEVTSKVQNYNQKIKQLIQLSQQYKGYSANNVDHTIFISKIKSAK